jgi:hypothetical protein
MRLTLTPLASFPIDAPELEAAYAANARIALHGEMDFASARAVCQFLDLPEVDEASLDLADPLRFATVRLMRFLRAHGPGHKVDALCRFSAAAQELHAQLFRSGHSDESESARYG